MAQLSKSVAKAQIEPERARRNVDIPRFFSWPIPSQGAFATDLDTPRPGSSQESHPPHRVKGFAPGRTGTGGGGAGVAVPPVRPGAHRNRAVLRPDARRESPIVLAGIRIQRDPRGQGFPPRPRGPLSSRGSAPGFPIPGELPPSPERPASGSLRPSAVSARTPSSGSPTLASPPVRRQPLCNPTTLNTHPPTAWETSANSTPARRCCPCCAWCACCIAHVLLLLSALLTRLCLASAPEYDVARGAGLSLPAHGPSSSRGSAPGFPFRGNSLLRQSDRPRAP